MLERDYLRRGVAEFVGTFALVFVAAGGSAYARSPIDLALAYGLVIAVMVSAFAFVSGGHFNPAVTLGFLVTRRIGPVLALLYWIVQLGASVLAALLLKWILPSGAISVSHLGTPSLGSGVGSGVAVVVEAVLTFFLVWVMFATIVDARGPFQQVGGLAVGFMVAAGVLMAYGISGGVMNPARAFGPQLAGNHWTHGWVWYVGPLAGAVIAAAVYELVYLRPSTSTPVAEPAASDVPVA